MKIEKCEVFRYDLPLIRPLGMMGQVLTRRSGLIILIHDEKGNRGAGEVAPFPGLHKEDLVAARDYLFRLIAQMPGLDVSGNLKELEGSLNHWLEKQTPPSVRYGIEQALLLLLSDAQRVPLYQLLFKKYNNIVCVNGLLTGPADEMIKEAKQYMHEGYRTLKLKVGQGSIDEDIRIVESVRGTIGKEVGLRLDANGCWSLEEAVYFGRAVAKHRIEYIEEPTEGFEELSGFYHQTGIPIALDESLFILAESGSDWPRGIRAVILKPTMVGGIFKTMELAGRAKQSEITPVISCAFLSGFSLALLTQLSAGIGDPGTAMGLDTYKWFQNDILQKPFSVRQGQVDVRDAERIMRGLRFDVLVKLA